MKGIYAALDKGDVPSALAAFDPKIQRREAENFLYADGSPYAGPRAVAESVFQRIVTYVENFAVVPERFIEGNDSVVVEGRYKGKIKKTGTSVDAQFAHVWQLRDGKVVRFQQCADTQQWAKAAAS